MASQVQSSPIGLVPKSHQVDKWQLIVDLSHPYGHSVNDGILPDLCSLSYSSVDKAVQYLSALHHFQICAGFPDPSLSLFPRLNYMLKGVHRAHRHPCRPPRLPITPDLLRRIYHTWSRMDIDYDRSMLWAAFCLGFFGFL